MGLTLSETGYCLITSLLTIFSATQNWFLILRGAKQSLLLQTNGGTSTTSLEADVPLFGTVWYDPKGMTNVLSLAKVQDRYKVEFDSSRSVFIVHNNGLLLEFRRSAEGLYYYKPMLKEIAMMQTVEDYKIFYTNRQIDSPASSCVTACTRLSKHQTFKEHDQDKFD